MKKCKTCVFFQPHSYNKHMGVCTNARFSSYVDISLHADNDWQILSRQFGCVLHKHKKKLGGVEVYIDNTLELDCEHPQDIEALIEQVVTWFWVNQKQRHFHIIQEGVVVFTCFLGNQARYNHWAVENS